MSAVVHNFKKFFWRDFQDIPAFKQPNFLNLQPERFIADLVSFAERSRLPKFLPSLNDHRVLLVAQSAPNDLAEKLAVQKPAFLVDYRKGEVKPSTSRKVHVIKGEIKPLPFKSGHFDCVVLPVSTELQFPFHVAIREVSRVLENSGRLVFSVIHPCLELLLTNQNPASSLKAKFMLQDYLKILRENFLFVEDIAEVIVDRETKSFFMHEGEGRYFEEFAGFPLVLMVRAVRYVR